MCTHAVLVALASTVGVIPNVGAARSGILPRSGILTAVRFRWECCRMTATPPPPPPQQPPQPPPPKQLSQTLVVLDAAMVAVYSLTASVFKLAMRNPQDLLAPPWQGMDLQMDLRDINLEFNSAIALAFAWAVGGVLGGACDESWISLDAEEHQRAPFGVARVLRGWLVAAPVACVVKALGVAAVVLPLGGGLRVDALAALADIGGLLAVILLWRRWLLSYPFNIS